METIRKAALFSVTDKTGIGPLAEAIVKSGRVILSTGGTADKLRELGVQVIDVETVTGFPSIMDGRLKTLHPKLFGAILHDRKKPKHLEQAQELIGLEYDIDIVVINLYDFAAKPSIAEIDIGGPSHLRAGSKNCADVSVLIDNSQYPEFIAELETGFISELTRARLAGKLFRKTSEYDGVIADWFESTMIPELEKLANESTRV